MATEDARKLFVAGLPDAITEDVLREIFEAAGGTVVEVSLPRDRATGRPRGFGFVTLSTSEDAANVRGSLDGSMQAGRSISVRPFSSEPPRRSESTGGRSETSPSAAGPAEDRTLYVGNLPYDTSQVEVTQLLEQNGVTPIVRVHLPAGPDGRLRGFGFITLGSAESANAAIISLRGVDIRGRRLMVNIAHPRGAPGAPSDRGPRPTGPSEGGGWPSGPRPDRSFGPPPEPPRGGGPGGGPGGGRPDSRRRASNSDAEEAERNALLQKKKKGAARRKGDPSADRGGGGSWQSWKWDDDD